MADFTEKKISKAKSFLKKVWCMLRNNWGYKLLAFFTAFVMWMLIGFIL